MGLFDTLGDVGDFLGEVRGVVDEGVGILNTSKPETKGFLAGVVPLSPTPVPTTAPSPSPSPAPASPTVLSGPAINWKLIAAAAAVAVVFYFAR